MGLLKVVEGDIEIGEVLTAAGVATNLESEGQNDRKNEKRDRQTTGISAFVAILLGF